MAEKKLVWVELHSLSLYDLEGTIDQVIAELNSFKTKYPGKILRLNQESGKYEEDSDHLVLQEQRLETDGEFMVRQEKEEYDRQNRERWDRGKHEHMEIKIDISSWEWGAMLLTAALMFMAFMVAYKVMGG